MRFVTIVWIREIKLAKIIFLCLILKFEEIFPKNGKLSPKDKIISPINRKISPKDKMISPKENCLLIIYPGTDCCRWFSVACRTEFWMWFLGGEGEGCIFNLYIIFFFRTFSIFDPRVFFSVFTLTLHAYIYKRVFNPSPFTFLAILLMVRELRVKGGEGTSLLSLNTFLHLGILRRVWLGKEKYELA